MQYIKVFIVSGIEVPIQCPVITWTSADLNVLRLPYKIVWLLLSQGINSHHIDLSDVPFSSFNSLLPFNLICRKKSYLVFVTLFLLISSGLINHTDVLKYL